MVIPLNKIETGRKAKVVWVASDASIASRFRDLGFVPDEEVCCVLSGRKDGMRAYLIRNALIGIRNSNAREIFVRPCEDSF